MADQVIIATLAASASGVVTPGPDQQDPTPTPDAHKEN